MSKKLMFQMRLDEEDKARLDAVAKYLSAPAATAVRILIKEKFESLPVEKPAPKTKAVK